VVVALQTWVVPPPQAATLHTIMGRRANIPSIARQRRRRVEIPVNRTQARIVPPVEYQGAPRFTAFEDVHCVVCPELVAMVSVAVPAVAPLMLTGVVDPKLNVGMPTAPGGLAAITAVSAMRPVNPPAGVKVIVEVLPLVAPAGMVAVLPLTLNPGGTLIT
jgi:hypothetical protein